MGMTRYIFRPQFFFDWDAIKRYNDKLTLKYLTEGKQPSSKFDYDSPVFDSFKNYCFDDFFDCLNGVCPLSNYIEHIFREDKKLQQLYLVVSTEDPTDSDYKHLLLVISSLSRMQDEYPDDIIEFEIDSITTFNQYSLESFKKIFEMETPEPDSVFDKEEIFIRIVFKFGITDANFKEKLKALSYSELQYILKQDEVSSSWKS